MKKRIDSEEEWLALRGTVITATEAPCLLGLNKYKSPNKMWDEKLHSTFRGNSYTYLGHLLEPVVVQTTNDMIGTNFKVIEDGRGKLFYTHPRLKLGATPDACDGEMFLECKTTKALNYLRYGNNPPTYYVMQLIIQLMCAGRDEGYLAILGTDLTQHTEELNLPLAIFKVKCCTMLQDLLEQELTRFWECTAEGKTFRVNSKVKKKAHLLIQLAYEKVY